MKKTFYIIDDHEMLRTGTSSYITSNSDWECAGLSATQGEALWNATQTKKLRRF